MSWQDVKNTAAYLRYIRGYDDCHECGHELTMTDNNLDTITCENCDKESEK